ncbi:MAG TPA: hypothetical protein VFX49_16975 [Chloroflexota bacterium]|nr:hypothetical protein [Chloroflexota bacterium]
MDRTGLDEEAQLRRALALDDDELAFLRAAALPERLAAQVAAARRGLALDVLWIVLPAALAYGGWLVTAPLLGPWLGLVGQAGLTNLLAAQAVGAAWALVDGFAGMVETASALPGFETPLALIAVLAALTYVVGLTAPRVRRQPAVV